MTYNNILSIGSGERDNTHHHDNSPTRELSVQRYVIVVMRRSSSCHHSRLSSRRLSLFVSIVLGGYTTEIIFA